MADPEVQVRAVNLFVPLVISKDNVVVSSKWGKIGNPLTGIKAELSEHFDSLIEEISEFIDVAGLSGVWVKLYCQQTGRNTALGLLVTGFTELTEEDIEKEKTAVAESKARIKRGKDKKEKLERAELRRLRSKYPDE